MNGVIYYTKIKEEYAGKNMEHMIGEKLLEKGLLKEYGLNLKYEPRSKGEHGKPFFTLQPKIHYNISHSGKYVLCILAGQEAVSYTHLDVYKRQLWILFLTVLRQFRQMM